jgi:hypothetical protein
LGEVGEGLDIVEVNGVMGFAKVEWLNDGCWLAALK